MPPNGTSRRTVFKAAGVGAGVAALSGLGPTLALPALATTHPGMLHTQADLDRMREPMNAGAQPWKAGWDRLAAISHSPSSWTARPTATVIQGGTAQNYRQLHNDIHAACQNALRWRISGNTANGNTARDILNAWSGMLREVNGNVDRFLAAGLHGYKLANAAEPMRGYSGFDLTRFRTMTPNVSPAEGARWRLVPGLANSASGHISFESVNYPGYYLRHAGYDFSLAQNDGSSTLNADATFRGDAGLADSTAASFQSYNFTDRCIRHYDYVLRLDPISTDTERAEATLRITS